MAFTEQKIKHLAYLAKVELTEEETRTLAGDLGDIAARLNDLSAADTAGVEPLYTVEDAQSVLRADVVDEGGIAGTVTGQAPEREGTFYVVPKVLD